MSNGILTPDTIGVLQDERHIVYVRRAIHDLLLGSWNGRSGSVSYSVIAERVDDIAGYRVVHIEKYIYKVMDEYKAAGWVISNSRGSYIFTVDKGSRES